MKIALLHYTAPPIVGGVESVIAQHARLMTKDGHEVAILAGRGESFDEQVKVQIIPRLDSRNAEVIKVKGFLDKGQCPPAFEKLCNDIRADLLSELKKYDVLIAHNIASLHKNLALTAAINEIYILPGYPRLILWHHDLAWTTPRYLREMHHGYPWNLLCSPWEGAVNVAVSEFRRQQLGKLFNIPFERIRLITNGVDLNNFFKFEPITIQLVEQLKLDQADPLFLLPVRLTPRKNIELALYIMAELRKDFPKAALLVTGPEGPHNPNNAIYRQKLIDIRKKLTLEGVVHFLAEVVPGFIPDKVITDLYRLADALLLPSREEGFGIPLIEAAISSKPIFCADIPVLHELGGEDINYFDLDAEPGEIARSIRNNLNHDKTSRWARRAKHQYTWDAIYTNRISPLLMEVKP